MRIIATLPLLAFVAGCVMPAQEPGVGPPPPTSAEFVAAPPAATFTAEQLDQLLAPIALYPDPLLALMLPASTDYPELAAAADFLATTGSVNEVEVQPWDESIRALAHYPQITRWMADNPAWTQQLGDAFAAQPENVMNAVQRLRARARAAGTLVDTPQQVVVYEGDTIAIEPADPNVIYVPYYDPSIVYDRRYAYEPGGYFSYSPAFVTGWWLSFGLDWHRRHVWEVDRGERERWWREHHRDWNRPRPPQQAMPPQTHPWHPRTDRPRPHWEDLRGRADGRRSQPSPGAPRDDHDRNPRPGDSRRDDHGTGNHSRDGAPVPPTNRWNGPAPVPPTPSSARSPIAPATNRDTAIAPTPPPQQSTPSPGRFPTPPPTSPWRHPDHRGGSVTNDHFPSQPPSSPPPSAPSPSATPPGVSGVPSTIPPVGVAPRTQLPQPTPAPGYTPPPRGNGGNGAGWQRAPGAPAPAPAPAPVRHAAPPPPPRTEPQPQQPQPPPQSSNDGGRRDRGHDQDR